MLSRVLLVSTLGGPVGGSTPAAFTAEEALSVAERCVRILHTESTTIAAEIARDPRPRHLTSTATSYLAESRYRPEVFDGKSGGYDGTSATADALRMMALRNIPFGDDAA
jgi:hypothetical protein